MAGPVLIARVPGTPFTLDDLRHDYGVSETARAAFEFGRLVNVSDLGTLETFDLLYPAAIRQKALAWASLAPSSILRQGASNMAPDLEIALPQSIRRAHAAAYEIVGDRMVARVEPECVIFRVSSSKDLSATMIVAARVRAVRPRTRVFAFGRIFEEEGLLARAVKLFDAIALGDIFPVAEILSTEPRHWSLVPNLAYHDGARLTLTGLKPFASHSLPPTTGPEKFLYTLPAEYSKINVFDVLALESRDESELSMRRSNEPLPTMSTLRSIADQLNSRAIHFRGMEHSDDATLERRLLASGLSVNFSCALDPARAAKNRMGLMAAAGCAAVDVDLSSGSQRLLDTYYHREFTITDAERLMRASKFSGIFTTAHVTYPCTQDDYHTEDETLRLIRRANPSSVVVTPEPPKFGSGAKGLLAQEFGPFRRHLRSRALRQAAALKEKIRELNIPLDIDAATAQLAGLAGFRGREAEFTELTGLQLLAGDTTGLAETIERINAAAARPARISAFRPFTADGNAVAN